MGYLTKMNGESGQNSFSAVGFSILGQPPSFKLPCHFDQRDDCMDTGGRAMQGAIAEESWDLVTTEQKDFCRWSK